jgi:hypothetical protein
MAPCSARFPCQQGILQNRGFENAEDYNAQYFFTSSVLAQTFPSSSSIHAVVAPPVFSDKPATCIAAAKVGYGLASLIRPSVSVVILT